MDNFDLRKYLAENKLTQEEFNNENLEEAPKSNKIKKSELKEMIRQSFLEEDSTIDLDVTNDNSDYDPLAESENLNEGIFDTVKDKLLAAKDKIMSKISPEAIKMFKDKVEQALGKPASELGMEDLTLANAKKVGALVKDQLDEEKTLNEGLKETIGGILGILGLATGAIGAGIGMVGMGPWLAIAGIVMLTISFLTSIEVNEAKKDEMEDESRAERADVDRFEFEKGKEEGEDEVKGGTGNKFLDQLETLKQEAERLNDAKLIRQIDNTITYYTRQHIAKPEMEESLEEMDKDYYDAAERDDAAHIAALEKDMEDDKRSSRD